MPTRLGHGRGPLDVSAFYNPRLAVLYAPTVVLNTADASAVGTTPTLEFTGTDPDAEHIRYNVQIATDVAFIPAGGATDDAYFGTTINGLGTDSADALSQGQSFVSNGGKLVSAK